MFASIKASMRHRIAGAALAVFLAGCGNGDGGGSGPATSAAPEVVIQVSGAHTGTFESSGSIFCTGDPFGGPQEEFELYAMKIPEQFNLRMPRDTAPGRYPIASGDDTPFDFYYTDPQRVKYDNVESATVQLEAVPQAQGERLVGSIQATLSTDEGQSVEVEVKLDLDAGAQSFDECQ